MLSKQRASEVATGVDIYACMEHAAGVLLVIGDDQNDPIHSFGVGGLRDKPAAIVMGTLLAAASFLSVLDEEETAQLLLSKANQIAMNGLRPNES